MATLWNRAGLLALASVSAVAAGFAVQRSPLIALALASIPLVFLAVDKITWSSRSMLFASFVVLLASSVPWRSQDGAQVGAATVDDSASVWKLLLTAASVTVAVLAGERHRLAWAQQLLLGYAVVAAGGAYVATGGNIQDATARPARYILTVIAVAMITRAVGFSLVARWTAVFAASVATLSLLARGAGFAEGQRLGGWPIPMHPNVPGSIAAAGLLCAVGLWAMRAASAGFAFLVSGGCAVALILTGSRTSIAATVVAMFLVIALPAATTVRGVRVAASLAFVLVVVAITQSIVGSKSVFSTVLTRAGQDANYATITTRKAELDAVKRAHDTLGSQLLGAGMETKSAPLQMQDRYFYAPVDGTWSAAYLSAGIAGLALLFAAMCLAFRRIASAAETRTLSSLLLVYVAAATLTFNVLNDVTFEAVLFVVATTVGVRHTTQGQPKAHV